MYTVKQQKLFAISKYSLFFFLILQLTLPGLTGSQGLNSHLSLKSQTECSNTSVVFCIEDAEDKSFIITSTYFNFFGLSNPKKISNKTEAPNNYSLNLNNSRSPPLS